MTHSIGSHITSAELVKRAQSGSTSDIDYLLGNLNMNRSFLHCKLIDFALGQVSSPEGIERIKHYLFHGSLIQRNYAALYFKRSGAVSVVEEAFQQGCIDEVQAFSQ